MFVENDNYDDLKICHQCFTDTDIQRYILLNGVKGAKCNLCEGVHFAVDATDPNLIRMVRALVRYHYPEYEYNSHWGGASGPVSLLMKNNPIFRAYQFKTSDEEVYESIVDAVIGGRDHQNEIPLYKGCDPDGARDLFAISLKTDGSHILKQLNTQLETTNYSDLYQQYLNSLAPVFAMSQSTLCRNTLLYRARIGFDVHKEKLQFLDSYIAKKVPYNNAGIIAPPPRIATSGRANREGVSYYYLASDEQTAVTEVRPHPGHYVTVGQFALLDDLKLVDLITCNLFEFSKSEKALETYVTIKELAEEFQKPITPDVLNRYLKSQFIADIAKNLGYDGISFNSSVANGTNLAIFNKEKVKRTDNPSVLFLVCKQHYKLGKVINVKDGFMERIVETVEF
jgi:hypothetical protein